MKKAEKHFECTAHKGGLGRHFTKRLVLAQQDTVLGDRGGWVSELHVPRRCG